MTLHNLCTKHRLWKWLQCLKITRGDEQWLFSSWSNSLSRKAGVISYYGHTRDVLETTPPCSGFHVLPACTCPYESPQPVRTDSPLTHGIMGSVWLSESLRWELIYCNCKLKLHCILPLYLLCFKITLARWCEFYAFMFAGIKYLFCAEYTAKAYCMHEILYPTMHYAQCEKWTASHFTIFNITNFFFLLCGQNLFNVRKVELQCKTFLEPLHLACSTSITVFWILFLYNV